MLEVRSISAGYGDLVVVHDVSLNIVPGQVVVMLGPNGAGKTTLARSVSGALRPVKSGEVLLDGKNVQSFSPQQMLNLGVVLVPEGRHLFPRMTVVDNIELGAYHRRDKAEIKQDLQHWLEYFPALRGRARQRAGSLSGGEQQMVAIARGLMARPKYVLLDEPSFGLAPVVVQSLAGVIRDICAGGTAVFLVEQNQELALAVAEEVYVLVGGRIKQLGSKQEAIASSLLGDHYLGRAGTRLDSHDTAKEGLP